jgi:Fur family peroxide stress response transcriptional regulator
MNSLDIYNNDYYYCFMDRGKRKHSAKRDEILRVIRSTSSHPSARWVYEQLQPVFPRLSLGTVYRNIKTFREEGELAFVGVVQGEERFDGRVQPHPHFICSHCGKIIDIDGNWNENLGGCAKGEPPEAEIQSDVYVDHRRTVFYGLCGDCQKATKEVNNTVEP